MWQTDSWTWGDWKSWCGFAEKKYLIDEGLI
jgi:hypothetical protein